MVAVSAKPFASRFEIVKELTHGGKGTIQTGDLFFRRTDTRGPFGIHFSALVARLTQAEFEHASVAVIEDGEVYLVEVNDRGTVKERLIDWLDYCVGETFEIHRLIQTPEGFVGQMEKEVKRFFSEDAEYDFTYSDPGRFYCTESAVELYLRCGVSLMHPLTPREVFAKSPGWAFAIFKFCNWLTMKTSQKGFDLDLGYYFVGNASWGLKASPLLRRIYRWEPKV